MLTSLYYTSSESVTSKNASFKVLIVILLRVHVVWFVTLCCWMSDSQHFERTLGTTDPTTQYHIPEFSTV